jgi:hypothetical protein
VSAKRPIDIQRDNAVTLRIGGDDDKSSVKEFLSTQDCLYVIKQAGVFKIQLADDIDPTRTNPNIPSLSQRVLIAGYDDPIVARVLLTAKYLFDERNATVNPFVSQLFESCLVLTRQLLEVDAMTRKLEDEIRRKEVALTEKPSATHTFSLPSIPKMEMELNNIFCLADKAKDTILAICRLQFLPAAVGRVKLEALGKAVEIALQAEPELVTSWKEYVKNFSLIRNLRNASEHPKENYRIILTDFSMQPNGRINSPLIEIQHPDIPIKIFPVIEFLAFIRNALLEQAETILVFIRLAILVKHNPYGEWVAEFPKEERRHMFVRFYRAIHINGNWRILG